MSEYGTQAVTWQTAMNPVIALELLSSGQWQGSGVLGPEAFDSVPYLELMSSGFDQKFGLRED
jgi:saccharopine dehydrogenase-like NADP-dependent oxidoreductase